MSETNLLLVMVYASPSGLVFNVYEMAARETAHCMFFDGNRYDKKNFLLPKKDDSCSRFPYTNYHGKRTGMVIFKTTCKPDKLTEAKSVLTKSVIAYIRSVENDVRDTMFAVMEAISKDTDKQYISRWKTRKEAEAKYRYEDGQEAEGSTCDNK